MDAITMKNYLTFDLYDFKNIKCNFHTHTTRCKHAAGTEREYVEKAIEAGFEVLGFSDHAPYLFEDGHVSLIRMSMDELEGYVRTVEDLRQEYKRDIRIFTGLEMEFFPKLFEKTMEEIQKYPLDYFILGQHYFDDERGKQYPGKKSEDESFLETYVSRVTEAIHTGYFLYVAHPDIIHYVGDDAVYEKHMRRLALELKKHNMPIEINVNGCRKGIHYPNKRFIKIGTEAGNDFIVGVDAHMPGELTDYKNYKECVGMAPPEKIHWNRTIE